VIIYLNYIILKMNQIPGFDYSLNYNYDYSDHKINIVQYLKFIEIPKSEIINVVALGDKKIPIKIK